MTGIELQKAYLNARDTYDAVKENLVFNTLNTMEKGIPYTAQEIESRFGCPKSLFSARYRTAAWWYRANTSRGFEDIIWRFRRDGVDFEFHVVRGRNKKRLTFTAPDGTTITTAKTCACYTVVSKE